MTLMEELLPWLTPETHKSGLRCKILLTANLTQSTGVPEHCQESTPSKTLTLSNRKGLLMVIACPIADCGLSGATTITSPNFFIVATRARMPGAVMPSSLVTRMIGRVDFFFGDFFAVAINRIECKGKWSEINGSLNATAQRLAAVAANLPNSNHNNPCHPCLPAETCATALALAHAVSEGGFNLKAIWKVEIKTF